MVLSRDEHGFEAVLADLPNATAVNVLTYSLSGWKEAGKLLGRLRRLPEETSLRVITNIPSSVERTEEKIEEYKRLLDPKRFRPRLQAYYNLSTHAKVVATENVVYIGSANFSYPNSLECGLLLRGAWAVGPVVQAVFSAAMVGARPHPRTAAEVGGTWLQAAVAKLRGHAASTRQLAERVAGKVGTSSDLLAEEAGEELLAECDDLADVLVRIADAVEEEHARMHLLDLSAGPLRRLRELFDSEAVRELFSHDGQRYVEAVVADDPGLYVEATIGSAHEAEAERRDELLAAAAEELPELTATFEEVASQLEGACHRVESLGLPPGAADATGS